jgi:hypothetical protein
VLSHPALAKKNVPENTAQICQDGEDNDKDDLIDCDDQDCSIFTFCTPGVGIEFRTPAVITPFIDIRYGGAVGWAQDVEDPRRPGVKYDQMGMVHSVLLNFGYRIF